MSIACPTCGIPLGSIKLSSRPPRATSFESCLRKCEPCGVGVSNASTDQTFIYQNPLHNIPEEARSGALTALKGALNQTNLESKVQKFGFSTSEDALTWTVFSYLQRAHLFRQVVASLGLLPIPPINEPTVLLWGAPLPSTSENGWQLRQKIETTLKEIGELSNSYSEPDVMLDFGSAGLVIIEVKYRSGNAICKDRSKFIKYVEGSGAFKRGEQASDSGLYELARNWRIGFDLSNHRPITLVNLVV